MSANQLKRTLGVTYKTAWYLSHRIRAAMKDENQIPLSGVVEVDEAWVGGKRRGFSKDYKENKAMILGAVERGGRVRFKIEKHTSPKQLRAFIGEVVDADAPRIMTDGWNGYQGTAD